MVLALKSGAPIMVEERVVAQHRSLLHAGGETEEECNPAEQHKTSGSHTILSNNREV